MLSVVVSSPPWTMGGLFGSQNIFEGVEVFVILGGRSYVETCQNRLWKGNSFLINWILYLFFLLLNLARLYSCILCFHMSVLLYRSIKFPKFEYDQRVIINKIFSYTLTVMTFWHNLESLCFLSQCNASLSVSFYGIFI